MNSVKANAWNDPRQRCWLSDYAPRGFRRGCGILTLILSSSLGAQPNLPIALSSITTDTGDFAPGHRDFTRYTSPTACLEAAHTERNYQRRTRSSQILADSLRAVAPDYDTLPTAVTTLARTCAARILLQPLNVVSAIELPSLFELALWTNRDSLALAVLARENAMASNENEKQRVLRDALDSLLHAEPIRLRLAETLVARVDTLHPREFTYRAEAHERLLAAANDRFDRRRMRQEAEYLLHLPAPALQPIPEKTALVFARIHAYQVLELLGKVEDSTALVTLADRVRADFQQSGWTEHRDNNIKYLFREIDSIRTASRDSVLAWLDVDRQRTPDLNMVGKATPTLQAQYWFPSGSDTVQQAPGVVTLFLVPMRSCYDDEISRPWGDDQCTAHMERYAQWLHRYDATKLHVVMVAWTNGHALYSEIIPPAEEAKKIAWYFQSFLKLPVTVAVQTRRSTRDAVGFIHYDSAAVERQYVSRYADLIHTSGEVFAVLSGRDGRVAYVGPDGSARLDAVLAHVMGDPAAPLSTSRQTVVPDSPAVIPPVKHD